MMNILISLQLKFSREVVLALERTGIGKVVSVSAATDHTWELLEIDIVAIELPQYPVFPVNSIERIKIRIVDDCLPEVFCRQDFPVVPHLNVYENGDKTLCLFDVAFHDIKYMFNANMFINRIVYWFSKTARGELHQPDQPLEPFFPSVRDSVIFNVNEHPNKIPFIRFEEIITSSGRLLTQIPLEETGRGRLFAYLRINIRKTYSDNIINCLPQTLFELNDAFDEDILKEIDQCILPIWAIKQRTKEYMQLFQQKETDLKNCALMLLVTVSLARSPDVNPEPFELKAFTIETTFQTLYRAFGYDKEGTKLVKKQDLINAQVLKVMQHEVLCHLNRNIAQNLNKAKVTNCDGCFVQIGVGALGSQIANNCIRSGYGKWTYIDPDVVYPHNLSRHCLNSADIGQNKAKSMSSYAESIFPDKVDSCIYAVMETNILSPDCKSAYSEAIENAKMLIDTSASVAVERYACHELAGNTRCVSFFMNPSGSCAVMLLEDESREITLDILEMQYYNLLINNPKYFEHLKSEQRVIYSSSCRSTSLKYPQDNVAIFSGLCSKAIKDATNNTEGLIAIWKIDGLTIDSKIYPADLYKSLTCGSWTIKIARQAETKLYDNRKKKLPYETGGVLIGSYDYERKICYIVDFISSPEDSIESPHSYIRGSKGLLQKIRVIEDITAGNLGYVGEWHSHPNDFTEQSQDDKILMKSIVEYNATQSCPGCMVIVGETRFSVYLEDI